MPSRIYGVHPFHDPAISDEFYEDDLPLDASEFHVYADAWTAGRVDFFIDGARTRRINPEEQKVHRWNFTADELNAPHLGPMAQDFYAAFGQSVTVTEDSREPLVTDEEKHQRHRKEESEQGTPSPGLYARVAIASRESFPASGSSGWR